MNKTTFLNAVRCLFKNIPAEKLILKFTIGKTLHSPFARIPANYYQYSPGTMRKVSRGNINYELDISDYMEWCIYFGIETEPRHVLFNLAKKDSTVMDIGANVGEVTLNFAKLIGNKGKIHSFEPEAGCFSKLQKNISLNSFKNIDANNIGLGNKKGNFFIAPEFDNNKGGLRIRPNATQNSNVTLDTLDNYVEEKQIEKIDVIKIDVEGFEMNVLKGAEICLQKFKPVLFVELDNTNLNQQGASAQELISYLEKYYLHITNAETGEKINSQTNFANCHYDIIAVNK